MVNWMQRQTEPDLSALITRLLAGDTDLTDAEVHAFGSYAVGFFWHLEDSYLQYRSKTLDAVSWATDEATLRFFLTVRAYRVAWKANRAAASGPYREYVDRVLQETAINPAFDELVIWKSLMAHESAAR